MYVLKVRLSILQKTRIKKKDTDKSLGIDTLSLDTDEKLVGRYGGRKHSEK